MRLLVLPHEYHGGEVHSIDINASNSLVASGGKDHAVCLWLLPHLLNAQDREAVFANAKPTETLKFHQSTLRVIRWSSTDEHVLATGDADGHLFISNIQEKAHKLVYPWPEAGLLPGEIVDVSWSSDGRLVAWSTSDGKVHVYDTNKETVQELTEKAKDGKVTIQRSVAFDPTNNYFVTVGDDTFVNVHQFHYDVNGNYQFKNISKISKLMTNNPSTTSIDYKRISWSCDGEFFAVPTASKQLASLISLLSRTLAWENKISLVGHDLDCDVVKFAPHIYQTDLPFNDPGSFNVYHVIASTGADKTLVLWNTSKETPLFILRDLASKPIVDISWDRTGNSLIVASLDGRIIIVNFEEGELGRRVSYEVMAQLDATQRKHIKPFTFKELDSLTAKKGSKTTEIVDQKQAKKLKDAFDELQKNPTKAVETAPLEEEKEPAKAEANPTNVGDIVPSVIPGPSLDEIEADDILNSAMKDRASKATKPKTPAKPKTPTPPAQKTTTKNGKKRIQPVLISNGNANGTAPVSALAVSLTLSTGKAPKLLMEFDRPSYSVSDEVQKESKRIKVLEEGGVTKKAKRDLEAVKFVGSVVLNPNTTFAKVRLSIPKVRMSFRVFDKSEKEPFVLDIKNGQGNETAPARITYFKKEQQIWCDFIPGYIQLATEGHNYWAISTADGQILTYSHNSGKRYLPPIVLGSPLSFLESHGKYLMAVTAIAEVYVWDMEKKKLHLSSPLTLSSLLDLNNKYQEDSLSKADNITMCSITSKGIPLVTLSNGSGYLYNNDMGTWQTVTEAWWVFGSHYWDSIGDDKMSSEPQMSKLFGKEEQSSLIGLLEHRTNEEIIRKSRTGRGKYFNKISKNMIMKEGFESLENTISLSHLENRILCCELLGEFIDFHDFLITYTKRICELGLKAKLFDICQLLLGEEASEEWVPEVCGYDKKELLKEIILSCAKDRDAQRILVHFSKKLGMIGEY